MKTFFSILTIFVFLLNSFLCVAEDNIQQVVQADENSSKESKAVKFTSNGIGKKILNAINFGLSILAIPFLFTGPTANILSNYAINSPLIQHSGHTISGALSNSSFSYADTKPIEETVYYARTTQDFILPLDKKECNWIINEGGSEHKNFELVKKEEDLGNSKEIFILKPTSLGTFIVEAKCILNNKIEHSIAYKIIVTD